MILLFIALKIKFQYVASTHFNTSNDVNPLDQNCRATMSSHQRYASTSLTSSLCHRADVNVPHIAKVLLVVIYLPCILSQEFCNTHLAIPENGSPGDCPSGLFPGESCQPRCNLGYEISGRSICSDESVFTPAVCYKEEITVGWTREISLPVIPWYGYGALHVPDREKIFLSGGYACQDAETGRPCGIDDIVVYAAVIDLSSATSSLVKDKPTAVYQHASAYYEGSIYTVGGRPAGSHTALATVEIYNLDSDTWTSGPSYPKALYTVQCVTHEAFLICAGGYSNGFYSSVYGMDLSDVADLKWDIMPSLSDSRTHFGMIAANGYIYVISGYCSHGCYTSTVEVLDMRDPSSWLSTSIDTPDARMAPLSVSAFDELYVISGITTSGGFNSRRIEHSYLHTSAINPIPSWTKVEVDMGSRECVFYCDNRLDGEDIAYYSEITGVTAFYPMSDRAVELRTVVAPRCDASAPPANGGLGDCTTYLANGSTCQPTCNAGYTVSGTSSCSAGTLTSATCSKILCSTNQRVKDNVCVSCPAGTTNAAGDDASGDETFCEATLCGANERVSDANHCVSCPPGTVNAAGDDASGAETFCDAVTCGANERVSGDNQCVACQAGTVNAAGDDASGAETVCDTVLCAANERVSASFACVPCPPGTINDAGDIAHEGESFCDTVLCGENEKVSASHVCVDCPPGTTNAAGDNASGAETFCDVTKCGKDQRVQSNACVACPPGNTNTAGDAASGQDTVCDGAACASNQRVDAANVCVDCPPGTTNEAGDDNLGEETQCDVTYCPVNHRVNAANECTECSAGSTNAAGDDASGEETFCEATICGVNERVSDTNACVSCVGKSTNEGGDDASGAETFCGCAEDERVVANECVTCPPGERRAGGDPVPGPDTMCSASLCVANERVFNQSCVACPDGSVNAAGDDASGGDTSCACMENRHVTDIGTCVECPAGTVRAPGDRIADGATKCDPVCVFVRPENGGRGTCEDTLAVSTSCSPKCYDGFISSGDTTCDENGQLTSTTCEPPDIEETPARRSARESKAKAQASRDEMLDRITDPKARKKVKILADAAIAGVPVKKLRLPMMASSAEEACDDALQTMRIDENLASCEADAIGRRRLAASYSVSVYLNPEEVSHTALQEAINNLDGAGIAAIESSEDPVAVLEEVPGIDPNTLRAFIADAIAAVEANSIAEAEEAAEAEDEADVPPPSEPPPGPAILVEDEYAGAREGIGWTMSTIVVSLVVALWA